VPPICGMVGPLESVKVCRSVRSRTGQRLGEVPAAVSPKERDTAAHTSVDIWATGFDSPLWPFREAPDGKTVKVPMLPSV
jgi:hypothetical protein